MLLSFQMNICILLIYHIFFVLNNITTWEYISWYTITYMEDIDYEQGSPFNVGWFGNIKLLIFPIRHAFWDWKPCKFFLKRKIKDSEYGN